MQERLKNLTIIAQYRRLRFNNGGKIGKKLNKI